MEKKEKRALGAPRTAEKEEKQTYKRTQQTQGVSCPKSTHVQNAHSLLHHKNGGCRRNSSHNRTSACTSLLKKLESSAGQPPARRERYPHNQSPISLATISGHSRVRQPGSQWGAAHAHSPPQVPGSTATLRDLQSVTRSKKNWEMFKKKSMKGVGAGTIGRKGGLSAVLRVSRSTTSLKGRPLLKRPHLFPQTSQGRGLGPGLGLGGGKGGRIKRGAPETVPLAWRPLIAPTASFTICVFFCVCVCLCHPHVSVSSTTSRGKEGGEKAESGE